MEDTITITLNDELAKQLESLRLDDEAKKKLQIWLLKQRKSQLQTELADINTQLDDLRK